MSFTGPESLRTFGEKPKPFQIEEDGEFYYVGSEVSVKLYCSNLYFWRAFLSDNTGLNKF